MWVVEGELVEYEDPSILRADVVYLFIFRLDGDRVRLGEMRGFRVWVRLCACVDMCMEWVWKTPSDRSSEYGKKVWRAAHMHLPSATGNLKAGEIPGVQPRPVPYPSRSGRSSTSGVTGRDSYTLNCLTFTL